MDVANSGTRPYRLGAFVDGLGWIEHRYGRVWKREPGRIVAAPDHGQVELMARLSAEIEPPFKVLYVLLVPRDDGQDEGRYELVEEFSREQLLRFLNRYQPLFEGDGRHHVWLASPVGDASIVYDQHNVLYLYGPLDRFARVLDEFGLEEREFSFPSPHSHHYHEELDVLLEDMLNRHEWKWFPLDTRTD